MKEYDVVVSPSANEDLIELVKYITDELQNRTAALHHVEMYKNALTSLRTFPYRNAVSTEPRLSATQSRIERMGNYNIVYQIDENIGEVHVVAIDYSMEDLSKDKSERRQK